MSQDNFIPVANNAKSRNDLIERGFSRQPLRIDLDIARSLEELDRARLADVIAEMEAKLSEKEGDEFDRALERLDHFKTVQQQVQSTAMH